METTLIKPIVFVTNEYIDNPTHVKLTFTADDYDKIARVLSLVKEHKLFSANIAFYGELLFDDEDELIESEFRIDVSYLIIYDDTFYFYGQDKWDSSAQIESDAITLDEILEGFKTEKEKV